MGAFVVGGIWLHGARAFAVAARPEVLQERGSVWVWLGWVVPIVNLWFPLQVVADIRRGCNPRAATRGIGGWWALWLVFTFALFFRYTESRPSDGIRLSIEMPLPVVEGVGALAGLGALWLWVRIVREVTAGQRDFIERLGAHRV
nr:DUF4328 domain-containing protein [Myceligenerans xiligouense]